MPPRTAAARSSRDHGGGAAGGGLVGHDRLPAEHGAQQGGKGQENARGFQAEIGQVVRQHRDQPGHQRRLDAIPPSVLGEVAHDQRQPREHQQGAWDAGLDQNADRLVLRELEPDRLGQALIDRIHAAKGAQADTHGMGAHDVESVPPQAQSALVARAGLREPANQPLGSETEGDADNHDQADEHAGEPGSVQRLALVGARREQVPDKRSAAQGQHRSARKGGQRAGREHRGDDLPNPLAVARRAREGEGEGGEGGQLEEFGGVVGIDEGADGQAAAVAEKAVDLVLGDGAMAEPDDQSGEAGHRHQAGRDEAHAAARGEHQRGEADGQCGGGVGHAQIGGGRVEAQGPRAGEVGKGEELGALGVEERAQRRRDGHDLRDGDDQEEHGQDQDGQKRQVGLLGACQHGGGGGERHQRAEERQEHRTVNGAARERRAHDGDREQGGHAVGQPGAAGGAPAPPVAASFAMLRRWFGPVVHEARLEQPLFNNQDVAGLQHHVRRAAFADVGDRVAVAFHRALELATQSHRVLRGDTGETAGRGDGVDDGHVGEVDERARLLHLADHGDFSAVPFLDHDGHLRAL